MIAVRGNRRQKNPMPAKQEQPQSLFDRLGGAGTLDRIVDVFYGTVMSDPRINHFFNNVNMDRQRAMQKAFLAYAFGGPCAYTGEELRLAHLRLVVDGLDDSHFDALAEDLGIALGKIGVEAALAAEVMTMIDTARNTVLGR